MALLHANVLDTGRGFAYRLAMGHKPSGTATVARAAPDGNLVSDVRAALGVSRRLFARLTGYSERAIAAWEAGRDLAEASRQRMLETRRLEKALARVIQPGRIAAWLDEPNRAFRGLKPLEVIERGEIDRIWRMVFELESGIGG
jgi:transcriptional regulator with XRE-family HTH domain